MKTLLIAISLFLGVFIRPAFASEININTVNNNENITIGNTFPIIFTIIDATPNTLYNFKFYGGQQGDDYSIQTYNQNTDEYLATDHNWSQMPSFYTNSSGYARVEGIAYISWDKNYCSDFNDDCYYLFIKIINSNDESDSNLFFQKIIVLSDLTSTPIPPTPTQIIIPTSTPIPTIIPQLISSTTDNRRPTIDITPTPTPNPKIFGTITFATDSATPTNIESLVFNSESSSSTFIETGSNPVIENKTNPLPKIRNFIPLILISLGGLSLIVPFLISKIKIKSKCLKK